MANSHPITPFPQPIPSFGNFHNLIGRDFGELNVLFYAGKRGRYSLWHCRCKCGREITLPAYRLTPGNTTSCNHCAEPVNDHITPFPTEINCNHFGSWLSGFTDGEGCFQLNFTSEEKKDGNTRYTPIAVFGIDLRRDDTKILRLIQSYLSCGRVYTGKKSYGNRSPATSFFVAKNGDHVNTIIPHFERFPLLAKKKNDFELWKCGVELMSSVINGPSHVHNGRSRKWTDKDLDTFSDIATILRKQREYRPNND